MSEMRRQAARRRCRGVVCAICGARHRHLIRLREALASCDLQGDDCAACCEQDRDGVWYVQGYYGSGQHDLERYRFVGEAPASWRNKIPICDKCIARAVAEGTLLHEGSIVLESSYESPLGG